MKPTDFFTSTPYFIAVLFIHFILIVLLLSDNRFNDVVLLSMLTTLNGFQFLGVQRLQDRIESLKLSNNTLRNMNTRQVDEIMRLQKQ